MKFLKQHADSLIFCLFEILTGVLLLINPVGFTSGILMAFGAVLIVVGLFCVVGYFRTSAISAAADQSLVKGLIALAAGAFCIFQNDWFIQVFPLLAILYGVAVLIAGFVKVQWTIDAIRLKTGRWLLPAISAAASIVCAVVILCNPFTSTVVLWWFTGAALIVGAVLDIAALIFIGNRLSDL